MPCVASARSPEQSLHEGFLLHVRTQRSRAHKSRRRRRVSQRCVLYHKIVQFGLHYYTIWITLPRTNVRSPDRCGASDATYGSWHTHCRSRVQVCQAWAACRAGSRRSGRATLVRAKRCTASTCSSLPGSPRKKKEYDGLCGQSPCAHHDPLCRAAGMAGAPPGMPDPRGTKPGVFTKMQEGGAAPCILNVPDTKY